MRPSEPDAGSPNGAPGGRAPGGGIPNNRVLYRGRKGTPMKKRHLIKGLAATAAATLALASCASDGGTGGDASEPASKDITIGVFNGWPEGEAASYVWKPVLEHDGYN